MFYDTAAVWKWKTREGERLRRLWHWSRRKVIRAQIRVVAEVIKLVNGKMEAISV